MIYSVYLFAVLRVLKQMRVRILLCKTSVKQATYYCSAVIMCQDAVSLNVFAFCIVLFFSSLAVLTGGDNNHQLLFVLLCWLKAAHLSPLATDAASQLDVLGHDSDPLGMDSCQVGVLEQTHQVGLSSLLESQHSRGLEPQVGLEVLGNLTHQPLEGQLADKQLSRLLVLPDLTQSHGTRAVPVLLNSHCN